VAIDTAGNVDFSHFEKVLPFTDLFLYDVKCIDPALHKKGVGVDNIQILTNLEKLCQCGKKIIVRIPCIPGFNDNDELERIKKYCQSLSLEFEILKYHEFGTSKKKALATSI
jgi:pyruvate formate lyase activating enzyme